MEILLSIKDNLCYNPSFLPDDDVGIKEVANFYLPFDTGFEVECNRGNNFNIENFQNIPNIKAVNIDSYEQRFRIPPGLEGFKCLYNISEQLKLNSIPNLGSGIHYHIDFTKYYHYLNERSIAQHKFWILNELDTWNYNGTYNNRDMQFSRCWVRCHNTYKTLEFRIGEMTFEYDILLKRIMHLQRIVKDLINKLTNTTIFHANPTYTEAMYQKSQMENILQSRKIKLF